MKWKIWAFIVGLIGTIFSSFLWIILRKHKIITGIRSKQTYIPLPEKNLQLKSVTSSNTSKSPLSTGEEQKKKATPTFIDRFVAVSLIVISVGLFVVWVSVLLGNFLFTEQPIDFKNVLTVPTINDPLFPPDGVSIIPAGKLNSKETHATLTLTISQIKNETPSEAMLAGTFDLAIPSELQAKICDFTGIKRIQDATGKQCGGKGPIAQSVGYKEFQLKSQYVSESLNLSIYNTLGFNGYSKEISLNNLFLSQSSSDLEAHIQIPVTFSLISQGKAYPDDWYWGDTIISISLPSPLYVYESPGDFMYYLPMDIRVLASAGTGNMTINIVPERSLPIWIGDLTILAKRSFPSWFLVYLTAIFIILAFLIFISHALFASKRKDQEPMQNVLLNAFIAVLTVAAVRQIMVPSDLQGLLTRLDLILIVAATVLLGLIFMKYALTVMSSSTETHRKNV